MKLLKNIFAAVLVLGFVQGAWAIMPGGALGGGTKGQPPQPRVGIEMQAEPTEGASIGADIVELTDVQINTTHDDAKQAPKVNLGNNPNEGQSNSEVDEESFERLAINHAQKKEMRRQVKDSVRKFRDSQKKGIESPADDSALLLLILLAILLPPLAVYLYTNEIGTEFWICLILTLIFWLPGIIYALFVILR